MDGKECLFLMYFLMLGSVMIESYILDLVGGREGGKEGYVGEIKRRGREREGERLAGVLPCHGSLLGSWAPGR